MESFWPANLIESDRDPIPPVTFLKEQGILLSKQTKNLLVGEVRLIDPTFFNILDSEQDKNFWYQFNLYSSVINYRYDLFKICYSVASYYPVEFVLPLALLMQVRKGLEVREGGLKEIKFHTDKGPSIQVVSQEDLNEVLREILNAKLTISAVRAILEEAQAGSSRYDMDDLT